MAERKRLNANDFIVFSASENTLQIAKPSSISSGLYVVIIQYTSFDYNTRSVQ